MARFARWAFCGLVCLGQTTAQELSGPGPCPAPPRALRHPSALTEDLPCGQAAGRPWRSRRTWSRWWTSCGSGWRTEVRSAQAGRRDGEPLSSRLLSQAARRGTSRTTAGCASTSPRKRVRHPSPPARLHPPPPDSGPMAAQCRLATR